jgi:AbrB family looped-hinge helix DNA binding protein
MRLTVKSQVTIPRHVRRELGIGPGSEVEFVVRGKTVELRPALSKEDVGRALVARLRGALKRPRYSTDEIMALTRGEN